MPNILNQSRFDPFVEMQNAVDVIEDSQHPTNKIAATIYGADGQGTYYSVSKTNFWPDAILKHFGTEGKIGNSSGTIHAETACILNAPKTEGASIFITDPFCPNCAKNMVEAGIRNIYIDHKGLSKDWIARNQDNFRQMSLRICERAGIRVFKIKRKEKKIISIMEVADDYKPLHENPVEIEKISSRDFNEMIAEKLQKHKGHEFACAIGKCPEDRLYAITARRHAAIGYSRKVPQSMEDKEGKYSFILQPVNRILMNAARHGLTLESTSLFSTRVPTAREQVNMTGAGIKAITIGDMRKARDDDAFTAMKQLQDANIVAYQIYDFKKL